MCILLYFYKPIKFKLMQIKIANRINSLIRIGISGPAGAGKSYSSLLLAKGIVGSLTKVAVIDTEKGSSNLYSHLGNYSNIELSSPYTPDKYIQAINLLEKHKFELIIIDSLSHAWEATVKTHSTMSGNSFKNWGIAKSNFNLLIDRILSSKLHVIATFRTKSDYIINQDAKGQMKPEKVGLKAITSDESDYEFTILFELMLNHQAKCTKDRTQIFSKENTLILDEKVGSNIVQWCNQNISIDNIRSQLKDTYNLQELKGLYEKYIKIYPSLQQQFTIQKQTILDTDNQYNQEYFN